MTDREQALIITLRSVGLSIDIYLARLQRGETIEPVGSAFLVLSSIRKDVQAALDEAGSWS